MTEITRILELLSEDGCDKERASLESLFPLVYDELRAMAKGKLAAERDGHTLQPTDLVHEAFMRLVGNANSAAYQNRKYFFAASAEAMRRILVEAARKKLAQKRGVKAQREWFDLLQLPEGDRCKELVDVHDSLDQLSMVDPQAGEVVKLRYFAGFTMDEIAELLGISKRQAQLIWAFARSWLYRALKPDTPSTSSQSI